MITFVAVYGIIAACIVLLTVAAALICCLGMKKKLNAKGEERNRTAEGERAFVDIYGNGRALAFMLINAETRQPVFVSPAVETFFGVTATELFYDSESVKKHIDKQYTRRFESEFSKWNGENTYEQEFAYGDGKYAKIEAFKTEYGGVNYIAFTFLDITVQKGEQTEMEKKLDYATEQLEAKSSFLSSMSHEIRTPMNGVMGMMSLARMNINEPEKALGYLDRAGELSNFLLSMINDILDISKIESGKMQLFNTELNIEAFADKIRNMFNGTVTGKGIDFLVETVGFTEHAVSADEMRLTQVLTNLISNANKFTPAGGKITVTFKELDLIGNDMQLLIRVRDTGKGIAPENIRKIMRPFEQEEASTAHAYGGTGLGLAICDNIIRLMGGNIVVDSELGKGSDFSVFLSLPVIKSAVRQVKHEAVEEIHAEAEDFTYEGCRILLAEDNEVNAEIAMAILEDEGAEITHAHDGREAVDIFVQSEVGSFDVVLLDIQMPRLNGREAAMEIRNSGKPDAKTVPIIALSADAFVEDIKQSEAAGMDGHVSKPIDFDELKKCVGKVIAAKKINSKKQKNKK